MSENAVASSLAENEYVKELLGILKDNGKDATGLNALLDHVKNMEDFCTQAESKITDMRTQLNEMKEIQDHPIKHALQNTIKALESKVTEIRGYISELKANIIDGCKNAVDAFKTNGVAALDKLTSFFRVKTCLEKIKNGAVESVKECDKTLDMIDTFSKEYHKTGRSIVNMARILIGMKPIDNAKESGKLAKAVGAPCRVQKACALGIRNAASSAIVKLDRLSQSVETKHDVKPDRSFMKRLDEKKELVRQKDLERPVHERAPQSRGVDL